MAYMGHSNPYMRIRANSNLPMTVGVTKVEAGYRGICNVVIRHITTNIVPAIVAEVQCVEDRVKLHSNYIPDACRCSPRGEMQGA